MIKNGEQFWFFDKLKQPVRNVFEPKNNNRQKTVQHNKFTWK